MAANPNRDEVKASLHNPMMSKGSICSRGFLVRNDYKDKDDQPDFKGRVFVKDTGWFWVAGWSAKRGKGGDPYISFQLSPMSDAQADRYCVRRGQQGLNDALAPTPTRPSTRPDSSDRSDDDSDIPF